MIKKTKKAIFGHDIFISYSRRDSLDYAYGIAEYFMAKGYDCYIDQLSSISPGKNLPVNIQQAVVRSTAFVLVGSEGAQSSEPIEKEINLFLEKNRNKPIIPITIDGAINPKARWFPAIEGLALIDDTASNLKAGIPDESVHTRILNSLKFTRKSIRLRYLSFTIACLSLLLIGLASTASFKAVNALKAQSVAERKKIEADSLTNVANNQKKLAEDRALIADSIADKAENDAVLAFQAKESADSLKAIAVIEKEEAEYLSMLAKEEARKSERMAQSNFLAMNASNMSNTDPTLSYNLAKTAYKIEPDNVYTYNAIAHSINNAPFYKERIYFKEVSDFDYSPDGNTIALINSDRNILLYNRINGSKKISEIKDGGYENNPTITYSKNGSHLLAILENPFILDKEGNVVSVIKDTSVKALNNETYPRLRMDSASFDPSGEYVITWSTLSNSYEDSKQVRKVWNLKGIEVDSANINFQREFPVKNVYENWEVSTKNNTILVTDKLKSENFFEKDDYTPIELKGHLGTRIWKTQFSPDGSEIASIGSDNYFIIWNYKLPKENKVEKFVDILMHKKSSGLIAYDNNKVVLKDINTGSQIEFSDHKGVQNAGFFKDGTPYIIKEKQILTYVNEKWKNYYFKDTIKQVVESDKNFCLLLGNSTLGLLYRDLNKIKIITEKIEIESANISPDSKLIAVKFNEDSSAIYDLDGKMIFPVTKNIKSINFSPEGKHIVVNRSWGGGWDEDSSGAITLKVSDNASLSILDLKGKKIWSHWDSLPLSISFNGTWQHVMTTNFVGENIYWNIPANKKLFTRQLGMVGAGSRFTKNRKYFLSMAPQNLEDGVNDLFVALFSSMLFGDAELPRIPKLWDVNRNIEYEFKGDDIKVKDAEFSPNDKFILAYDFERNVTIWNVETKKQLELTGHYKKIKQVEFSDDGKWILTYSEDGTLRLWDYDGNEIYTFDQLEIDPDEIGFITNSSYVYIKKYASVKFKMKIGDREIEDDDKDGDESRNADSKVIFKTINPEYLLKQIDMEKQLGTVWEMDSRLKTKYKVK